MIGAGYVGLVSAACFSEFGYDVSCVDRDAERIDKLQNGVIPIYEPGLDQLVKQNAKAGRLKFTTGMAGPVRDSAAVFIAVGTPTRRGNGIADTSFVMAAAEEMAPELRQGTMVILKSTVPVGTARQVKQALSRTAKEIHIVSNPEFLREGSAIEDFMQPDRVVIGTENDKAAKFMRRLYRPLVLSSMSFLFTSLESAELVKYATNAFLAMKVTFINQMADLCEKTGADIGDIAKGLGLDKRIGPRFLQPGPGFGGSCFPKDIRALDAIAEHYQVRLDLVAATISANESRKKSIADRVMAALGTLAGKRLAVLGLTYKPNTDDMREAPSLTVIPALQKAGAEIVAFDPAGMAEAKKLLPGVTFCRSSEEAVTGADALIVLTEWNVFRALDFSRLKNRMRGADIFDFRNIYRPHDVQAAGFRYFGLGSRQ